MDLFCDSRTILEQYGTYVNDLRRLFVFHGLHCGAAEDFGGLALKLTGSQAFRTDVSALARGARDLGHLSAEEMLTVIALASGGDELVEGRAGSAGMLRTIGMLQVLLSGIGGWRESTQPARPTESVAARTMPEPEAERIPNPPPVQAAREEFEPPARTRNAPAEIAPAAVRTDAAAQPGETAAAQLPLELAITEIKVYLDDIDRRIGRLEPRLDDISQFVQTSASRLQRPAETADAHEPAPGLAAAGVPLRPANGSSAPAAARMGEDERSNGNGFAGPARESASPGRERGFGARNGTALVSDPERPPQDEPRQLPEADEHSWNDVQRSAEPLRVAPVSSVLEQAPAVEAADSDRLTTLRAILERGRGGLAVATAWRGRAASAPYRTPAEMLRRRSNKEGVGALLGLAAMLLVVVGIVSLTSGQAKRDPASAVLPATGAPAAATGQVGQASPATPPSTFSAAAAPPLKPSVDEPPAVAKVAGKRSEMVTSEPRVEDLPPARDAALPAKTAATAPVPPPAKSSVPPPSTGAARSSTPPADAVEDQQVAEPGKTLIVPASAMQAKLVSSRDPVYPPGAASEDAHGTVTLNAFIAKDGTVRRMDVVGGPSALVKPALAAVSWRRYRPYLVHGRPVEVETQVTVDFPPR